MDWITLAQRNKLWNRLKQNAVRFDFMVSDKSKL